MRRVITRVLPPLIGAAGVIDQVFIRETFDPARALLCALFLTGVPLGWAADIFRRKDG